MGQQLSMLNKQYAVFNCFFTQFFHTDGNDHSHGNTIYHTSLAVHGRNGHLGQAQLKRWLPLIKTDQNCL